MPYTKSILSLFINNTAIYSVKQKLQLKIYIITYKQHWKVEEATAQNLYH